MRGGARNPHPEPRSVRTPKADDELLRDREARDLAKRAGDGHDDPMLTSWVDKLLQSRDDWKTRKRPRLETSFPEPKTRDRG